MAILTVEQLKTYFQTGDYPKESDYANLIDTIMELAGGSASITSSDTAPINPDPAALWYNTTEGRAYVFYDGFWVELVPTIEGPPGPMGETGVVAAVSPLAYDANSKTISISTQSLFSSPNLTGIPTAPTAQSGTNTTQIATTAFVRSEVASVIDSAPTTLDTLNELAAALGDDPNFATTMANSLATVNNSITTLTNNLATANTNISNLTTSDAAKAPLLTNLVLDKTASFSIQATDAYKTLVNNSANSITITVPNVLSPGQRVDIINYGTGIITIAGSGLTSLLSKADKLNISAKSAASILCIASGYYFLTGALE